MIGSSTLAKAVFVATFMVLFIALFRDHNFASLAIFSTISLFALLSQTRPFFWQMCLVFFGLMSILYSFRVLGGLEPNGPGILATGTATGVDMALFSLLILSTVLSLVAGSGQESVRI